ncbi:MAG: YqhA family protein [Planctomycetota bacterium]
MERLLFSFRFISWIAILCSITGSLLMFLIGALKTYKAIATFLFGKIPHESLSRLKTADVTTAYLIKSLDAFLIALVLLIFSYGVYSLFISKHSGIDESGALKWIRIPSIAHLKNILAEVIIVILFVKFLEVALLNLDNLMWTLLVLPCSILLLALSLKLLGLRGQSSAKD